MKNLIINIFLIVVFAFSLQNITIGKNLFLPFGDDDIVSETNQYLKRVNLDEGKVLSKNDLNKFIQTAYKDNWYNDIAFWTSAQWGIKESGGNVAKQYELNGKDLTTDGFDKRPVKISEGNIFGVKYNGKNNYSDNSDVTVQNPMSLLLVFKANNAEDENALVSSKGSSKLSAVIQKNKDGVSELVIRNAGEIYTKGLNSGINIVFIEFNIKNSRVFINGDLAYNGVIGKSEFDGLMIGRAPTKKGTAYFDGVMYETGVIKNLISDDARTNLTSILKQVYQIQ
mgnify:CR=1 FL=1